MAEKISLRRRSAGSKGPGSRNISASLLQTPVTIDYFGHKGALPTSPPWRAMRGAIRAEKRERKEKKKEGFLPHPLTRGRWGVSGMILVFCFAQAGQ